MRNMLLVVVSVMIGLWNAAIIGFVCSAFAGFVWGIESVPIRILMVVPLVAMTFMASQLTIGITLWRYFGKQHPPGDHSCCNGQ